MNVRMWLGVLCLCACTSGGVDPDAEPGSDASVDAGTDVVAPPDARDGSPGEDGGPPQDAAPPVGRVPIFIAQGMMGRSTISCDDGRTWIANRSFDLEGDALVCGETGEMRCSGDPCPFLGSDGCTMGGGCDCGHHPGFSRGIVFGEDLFVATWGWGHPGTVRYSRNGIDWEVGVEGLWGHGGIAYGAGSFVLSSRSPYVSADGATWSEAGEADFRDSAGDRIWSVRRFGYGDHDGGRFVAFASGAERDVLVSSDAGRSWWRPRVMPDDCGVTMNTYGSVLYGNGTFVAIDMEGNACWSTDGGQNWAVSPITDDSIVTTALFDGDEFLVWAGGRLHQSADGQSWTATEMTTPIRLAAVARSDEGTFVATGSFWNAYEEQRFYRSTDGLDWEELPSDAFVGSHAIFHITFGYAEPSELCPLP